MRNRVQVAIPTEEQLTVLKAILIAEKSQYNYEEQSFIGVYAREIEDISIINIFEENVYYLIEDMKTIISIAGVIISKDGLHSAITKQITSNYAKDIKNIKKIITTDIAILLLSASMIAISYSRLLIIPLLLSAIAMTIIWFSLENHIQIAGHLKSLDERVNDLFPKFLEDNEIVR